jgi:hypothetical protein
MTPKASVESSRMASAALSTDELLRWVKGKVGKADYSVVVPMRPKQGYVSLVSPLFVVFGFGFLFFSSQSYHPIPSIGAPGLPDCSTSGPRGRDSQGGVSAGGRGEEAEEGRGEEAGPQEDGGPRFAGEATQSASKG